ncbi:hypothetical protein [Mycobacterium sp. 852002-51057_SCH5723018]|uniref:hypothetical protein n=1 Tax=Mycobacterium sp. 852002-51057_SCH5723018 TaxID=1834094 RepID=UPI0007FE21CE|nr:hypothetical protein [Mycobacterium sp. 852002-51057_SCH5723018]OBG23227.1 hypothetical protein A5764_11675 [Mycobacterium sp. 852002-51057_SCH5723018]
MVATLIILDVFVGILALLGLIAVWNQVRARQRTAGTKGVVLVSERLQPRRRNIARFQTTLRIVGPVVRYDVALDLEADGSRFEASPAQPATRPSMGCDDEELSWTFEVPDDDVDRLWVVVSWLEARGYDLRPAAITRQLSTSETYVWKWYLGRLGGWRSQRTATAPTAVFPAVRSRPKGEQS